MQEIFLRMNFFYFSSLGWKVQGFVWENIRKTFFWENITIVLILELESSISQNIRNFFISGDIQKASVKENIRSFLILEPKSSISWNIRNFFIFSSGLGWERHQVALNNTTASEFGFDRLDTTDYSWKWLVDSNAGKTPLASFDRSFYWCENEWVCSWWKIISEKLGWSFCS